MEEEVCLILGCRRQKLNIVQNSSFTLGINCEFDIFSRTGHNSHVCKCPVQVREFKAQKRLKDSSSSKRSNLNPFQLVRVS